MEVNRLHDVLKTHFPGDRVIRDLHHHFTLLEKSGTRTRYDLIFDITFFQNLEIPYLMEDYQAAEHGNRIPTMAINIPTAHTWHVDMSGYVDACKALRIPLYIVFEAFQVTKQLPDPPFLRAYYFDKKGNHVHVDLRHAVMKEGESMDPTSITGGLLEFEGIVPFRVGLMETKGKVLSDWGELVPTYGLVLVTEQGTIL
jgi:hypothetical protein